jgi:hypothetical protein
MGHNFLVAVATKIKALDAERVDLDGGFMDVYDGSQPATPQDAITSQVKLARLPFGNPAFAAAVDAGGGIASTTANAITSDTDADATGTATWFRAVKSNGTTAVADGTVGTTSAFDAVINSTAIQIHARVDCSSCVISL